ncbi:MAG: gas vesicle protein [Actinophytocola sp.]|nr:gas vesicle protein [Actinophytocola sp.]
MTVAHGNELSATEAARAGLERVAELTGKETSAVTEVSPTDEGWLIGVEVVEENRIPSSSDMLAIYELETDLSGEVVSYRRTKRYPRGAGNAGNGG